LILDALQEYIRGKSGSYHGLSNEYSVIRMFFAKNRAPLPDDYFNLVADRESVQSRLTVEIIKNLIDNVQVDTKARYLTIWQGLLDQERFITKTSDD
jgi:hypothetical protein